MRREALLVLRLCLARSLRVRVGRGPMRECGYVLGRT